MTSSLSPTLQLATDLIRCRSVTPEDDGCQEMMIKRLEAIGFKTERLRFGEVDNFWAIRNGIEGDSGSILAFAGHTDVVPTGPEANWNNPPFEPKIIDGMLHGHVIRPPYAGRDSGDFVGNSLIGYDEAAVAGMAGLVAIVRAGDFLGVVADAPHLAQQIAEALPVKWRMPPHM